jgi:glutathione S-transferase
MMLIATILIVCFQLTTTAKAWVPSVSNARMRNKRIRVSSASFILATTSTEIDTATTKKPLLTKRQNAPSWDELSQQLSKQFENENDDNNSEKPLVTLFRDTNGWCPFCEKVWFALKIKNIPYTETLISLFDKPKWFLDMVPTGLVPAVLIHNDSIQKQKEENDESDNGQTSPQRMLIWESLDIIKALDEQFPDTPKLIHEEDPEYMSGRDLLTEVTSVGFLYVYNMRNETLTDEEKELQLVQFEEKLDELDQFIGEHTGSSFFLNDITGLDVEAVPMLERWRYQLPLTKDVDITKGRHNIKAWFDAMDQYEPYTQRVAGDKYSWVAVASTFLQIFGANKEGLSQETKDTMTKVDVEAVRLRNAFALNPRDSDMFSDVLLQNGNIEAATKLLHNHKAIVKDCTNKDPKSQKDVARAHDENNADWMLRVIAAKLLSVDQESSSQELVEIDEVDAANAAKTVANRLCVPRDMGGPAAAVLRHELAKLASELTE